MATRWPLRATVGFLMAALAMPAPLRAQVTDPPTTGTQTSSTQAATQAPTSTPNLDRIREALNKPQTIVFDTKLTFRVDVTAKWPTFAEMAKGYDLRYGPTPRGNPMTHQEFLNMVTPREMYGSAGIRAGELLQMAVVNAIGQLIVKRGLEAISKARNEREVQAIREQIERELVALKGGK